MQFCYPGFCGPGLPVGQIHALETPGVIDLEPPEEA